MNKHAGWTVRDAYGLTHWFYGFRVVCADAAPWTAWNDNAGAYRQGVPTCLWCTVLL